MNKLEWHHAGHTKGADTPPIFFVPSPYDTFVTMIKITCLSPMFDTWEICLLNNTKVVQYPGSLYLANDIKKKAEKAFFDLLTELILLDGS